jgi:hypothetical protein
MNLNDIQPNSFAAIICFALYICAQDQQVSNDESNDLLKKIKNIIEFDTEFSFSVKTSELEKITLNLSNLILSKDAWLKKEISTDEEDFFLKKLTDDHTIELSLRLARMCAATDGFHKNESYKFRSWFDKFYNGE